jgi:hypothetical protein
MGRNVLAAGLLGVALWSPPASAQTTVISQLATWDTPPTGSVFAGGDFDPTLDNTATCSGCWYGKATGSGISYSYSTAHTTQGTGALKAVITGKGAGGEYSVNINGSPVQLDTHYDDPLLVTYSNSTGANGGVLDPRFTALNDAINSGQQSLYNIEFDITYDVASMRSIPWQPPEETVDPTTNGQFPQRYFWTGSFGGANDSFQFVCNDCNTIQPFDTQYDSNLFPVFHASIPLSAFNFVPDASAGQHTFRQLGMLYNSVFGTLPAAANTSSVTLYLDNLQLTKLNPVGPIDYNNDGQATAADWNLFMAQYLVTNPPPSASPNASFDLVGNFGAAGTNGKVDFFDLQKFQEFYKIANPGAGASLPWNASVPEPSALVLGMIAVIGLAVIRSRNKSRLLSSAVAAAVLFFLNQQTASAQLVEGFETIGPWAAWTGADPNAIPITVAASTSNATQGTHSMKVTQGSDNLNMFSWDAATVPSYTTGDTAWDVLSHAVRVGAEHYNLLADVTFDPAELSDQGVNSLTVTLGLNFTGQTIGVYSGETTKFTTTATVPLSAFNLPDAVDNGATSYSGEIGFTGDNPADLPYSVYIDNIRLQQISTPDLLTLQVDRSTGVGTLKNLSPNPVSWNLFDIKSAGGTLNPAGWSSLHDQNADGPGTWVEGGGSTANEIAEASLLGSHTLAPGASLSLGALYNPAVHVDDLNFTIRDAAGPTDRTYDQLVTYVGTAPAGVNGDYNGDGVVDAADYVVWREHLNQTFQLQNEGGISPGVVDQADYTFWRSRFGATSGSGSGLGGSAAVPEPTGMVLMCAGLVSLFLIKDRA